MIQCESESPYMSKEPMLKENKLNFFIYSFHLYDQALCFSNFPFLISSIVPTIDYCTFRNLALVTNLSLSNNPTLRLSLYSGRFVKLTGTTLIPYEIQAIKLLLHS